MRIDRKLSLRVGLLGGLSALALGGPALAQITVGPAGPASPPGGGISVGGALVAPSPGLNPTGRAITLIVAAKDGNLYLGDVVITVGPDGGVTFPADRIFDLLTPVLRPAALETLRTALVGRAAVGPGDFTGSGIRALYNPQTLDLSFDIPPELRAAQGLSVASLNPAQFGSFAQPAQFSAFVNVRGNVDYIHTGPTKGLGDPNFFLDSAARLGGIVLENQAVWTPNGAVDYQRQGTRFVVDDTKNVIRWTAGDLQPVTRTYQSAPSMAGFSLLRSYSALQPQSIVRPRGDRSFTLERPSTVEIYINGQLLRRLQLAAGNYNLSDFPFTQGSNDVRFAITDDTGRTQSLRFNVFVDQTQLGRGISEFGLFAGVKSVLRADGPDYSDEGAITGFYRRGVSDAVTLGVNYQVDKNSRLIGAEFLAGSPIGTFGLQAAASNIEGFEAGYALTATFQRIIQRNDGKADALNLSYQQTSDTFGPIGTLVPNNPYDYEIGAVYSHAFSNDVYAGIDLRFSNGRGAVKDFSNYRLTAGWRLTPSITLTGDVTYQDSNNGNRVSGLLTLTARLGAYSSVRADYDTNNDRVRLGVQTLRGQGVGAWSGSADIERSNDSSGLNAVVDYIGNRGEIGLAHYGTYQGTFNSIQDQRSSLRVGTSLGFADGAFSIGRPIFDSFAVVVPHPSLKGAEVLVNPTPYGYVASTGILGAALASNLPSYSEQTLTVDAPSVPAGVDLGQGSFRVFPPYRSGYRLQVGSDYFVTAIGSMLDAAGRPLSLVSGTVTELAAPERPPLTVFTNQQGRFGVSGLRPGRWRVNMLGDDSETYTITVPENAEGVLRLEQLRPEGN